MTPLWLDMEIPDEALPEWRNLGENFPGHELSSSGEVRGSRCRNYTNDRGVRMVEIRTSDVRCRIPVEGLMKRVFPEKFKQKTRPTRPRKPRRYFLEGSR